MIETAYAWSHIFSSGAKDDRPDADLLSELVMCHRDRLKAWKPDDQLTRELATLNKLM